MCTSNKTFKKNLGQFQNDFITKLSSSLINDLFRHLLNKPLHVSKKPLKISLFFLTL